MPRRTDIASVLVIGPGPIVIGQACEFDYSGVQACRALREEGYRVILVNSNPATVMTDPELADATYIEPLTLEFVTRILEQERPDAILPTMGGQTALNLAIQLHDAGVLQRLGIKLIGADAEVIARAEDRGLFRKTMDEAGIASPRASVVRDLAQGDAALEHVGLPAILRPSFTLGGRGSGVVYNREEYFPALEAALAASPIGEVLVERSVLGWKEYELEVVRDRNDNCIVVCSIENIDPMGIHTGDSITVAPALTLTDKEFQDMRDDAIACLRAIGVETGGSNVQFAVNPEDGERLIIEMNPRVSRSSALASKATGFPIARVATRLALGYSLDELKNEISGIGPASFEPTLDWVVVKAPRFDFEKFEGALPLLTTSMRSVGEAMAIGGSFAEALQKVFASLEIGAFGLEAPPVGPLLEALAHDDDTLPNPDECLPREAVNALLARPVPNRLLFVAEALRLGIDRARILESTRFDPWILDQIEALVAREAEVIAHGLPDDAKRLRVLKHAGFTDARLAQLANLEEDEVRARRRALGVHPSYRRIDTCAAEFPSRTPYLYSTWDEAPLDDADEADPQERRKVLILGGGPNRIGQGIEFDYCCVHAVQALRALDIETVMINCNPETVSTDWDTADRLYFEPLTVEHVLEAARRESERGELLGAIVQFGGQTPLGLARAIERAGIRILGTCPDAIDLAEDRERFQALLNELQLRQPESGIARNAEQAAEQAERIGYPVLLRPSYVLGGRAMRRVETEQELRAWIHSAVRVSGRHPVLIDSYLRDAVEVDVDALSDGEQTWFAGAMEHVEEAGIHSGDSACSFPPDQLTPDQIQELKRQTHLLGRALKVVGLLNIQFAIQDQDVYVLEVNPRASRTVPFLTKATGIPLARLAARLMLGETIESLNLPAEPPEPFHAVKEAVLPFDRFVGTDVLLGPEMHSTGEVMGIDSSFPKAFLKAQLAAGLHLKPDGTAFLSVKAEDRPHILPLARKLHELGYNLTATKGTAQFLTDNNLQVQHVAKVHEGVRPNVLDRMRSAEIDLVINTPSGRTRARRDSDSIRRLAAENGIPCFTTLRAAQALVRALAVRQKTPLAVKPLQDYFAPCSRYGSHGTDTTPSKGR